MGGGPEMTSRPVDQLAALLGTRLSAIGAETLGCPPQLC